MTAQNIDIILLSDDQIKVRIQRQDDETWEKLYTLETPINNLLDDFKNETGVDLPQENLLLSRNIKELNEVHKLKHFINKYEEKDISLGDMESLIFPDIIAKPFNNPFCIFGFIKNEKTVKMLKLGKDDILNELEDYGPFSAYCNGNNNLFISGGEKKNGEYLEKFWKIDLHTKEIKCLDMIPKKNHSMIYVPGNYVFVVGGQDKETFYYSIEENHFFGWKPLNNHRIEPALIIVGDYLYCFDNVNSKLKTNTFSFEKTNLKSSDHLWELCQPEIPNMTISQKFFGIVKQDNDLIFIGGNMDIYDEPENENNIKKNYKYNITEGSMNESNVPFIECNLKEKTLLPYNDKISYIFPDFNKHHPEMLFYLKEKNSIRIVKYKSNNELLEEEKVLKKNEEVKIRKKIPNFNQPKNEENMENKENENTENINNINININLNNELYKEKEISDNKDNIEKVENINEDFKKEPENEIQNNEEYINNNNNYNMNENQNQNENNNFDNGIGIEMNQNSYPQQNENIDENGNLKLIEEQDKENMIPIPGEEVISKEKKSNEINLDLNVNVNGNLGNEINNIIGNNNFESNFNININEQHIEKENEKENDIITENCKLLEDQLKYSLNEQKEQNMNMNIDIVQSGIQNPEFNLRGHNSNINVFEPNIEIENKNPEFNLKIDKNITGDIQIENPPIPEAEIKIEQPNININQPDLNINMNNTELKYPYVNNSNLNTQINIPKPEIKTSDIKNDINLEMKVPDITGGLGANVQGTIKEGYDFYESGVILGIGASNLNTNINMEVPGGNLPNPQLELNGPKIETTGNFGGNLNMPNPSLKVSGTGVDINGPKIGLNTPNLGLNPPQMDINGPKMDINAPNMNFTGANVDIKGPNMDINPNLNVNVPKIDANMNSQMLNVKLPEGNLGFNSQIPNPEVNLGLDIKPDFYLSGYIIGANETDPNILKLKGEIPKPSGININGNLPNVNVSNPIGNPNLDLNINKPEVNVPGVSTNLKGPTINLSGNNISSGLPTANINTGNLNNEFNINANLPNIPDPKINIKSQNINLPNANLDINGPKMEINNNLPGISVPNPKVELPSGNIDVKGNLPDMNINTPNINTNLGVNIEGVGATGVKTPINLPGSNINTNIQPFEMKPIDIGGKVSGPNIKGEIGDIQYDFYESGIIMGANVPDVNKNINIPSGNINLNDNMSGVNINAPKLDINGNITGGNINMPKISVNNDINANINGPNINEPKVDINVPNPNIGGDINFNPTKVNLPTSNININQPEISTSLKEPVIDINLKGSPNIRMPQVEIKDPIVGGNFDSKINTHTNLPSTNLNVDIPQTNVNLDGNVKVPKVEPEYDFYLSGVINPGVETNINNINPNNTNNVLSLNNNNNINGNLDLNNNIKTDGQFGINVNVGGQGIGTHSQNIGLNFLSDDGTVQNTLKIRDNNIQKNKNILPTVGVNTNVFVSSKVDEAEKLDQINTNTDNLISANVGVGGTKIGGRINN